MQTLLKPITKQTSGFFCKHHQVPISICCTPDLRSSLQRTEKCILHNQYNIWIVLTNTADIFTSSPNPLTRIFIPLIWINRIFLRFGYFSDTSAYRLRSIKNFRRISLLGLDIFRSHQTILSLVLIL